METIKTITKDKYTLTHDWYMDDFGFKRNALEVSFIDEKGTKQHIPFRGKMRIKDYDGKEDIWQIDDVSPYKDSEYMEMLEEVVKTPLDKRKGM